MKNTWLILHLMSVICCHAQNNKDATSLFYPQQLGNKYYLREKSFSKKPGQISIDKIDFYNSTTNLYVLVRNGKYGVISNRGNLVQPFVFDSIINYDNNLALWKNGRFDYYLKNQKTHSNITCDSLRLLDGQLFYYSRGLVGLIENNLLVPAKYKSIRSWVMHQQPWKGKDLSFYLAVQPTNDLQMLNAHGQPLLPKGVAHINEISHGIIRFFDGVWKFYLPENDTIISSDGNDIIFYDQQRYKKYNSDRSQGTVYHISNKKRYFGNYDDYFFLPNADLLAVRKNNLIGLIYAPNQSELIPPQYHQINPLKQRKEEFRCYINDLCGVVNQQNETLVPLVYHNIEGSPKKDYYATYLKGKMGLVQRGGEEVFANEYKHIHFLDDQSFIIQKEALYGLASYAGEVICPIAFDNYRIYWESKHQFIEFYKDGKYVLYNTTGRLYPEAYHKAVFGNNCVKLYTVDKKIVVLYLNEQGGVGENYEYPLLPSISIDQEQKWRFQNRLGFPFDEHEEHQLTGKFGKRYFSQKGMSVAPVYTVVVSKQYGGLLFGELESKPFTHELVPGIALVAKRSMDYVQHNAEQSMYMNELIHATTWSSSSYHVRMNVSNKYESYKDARCVKKASAIPGKILFARELHFGEIRKLIYGSHCTIAPIEKSDVSLYEYYNWANNLGVFELSPENLIKNMNPALGVKFHNTKIMVCETPERLKNEKRDYFEDCPTFDFFDFHLDHQIKYFKTSESNNKIIERITFSDSTKREKYSLNDLYSPILNSDFIIKNSSALNTAIIHPNFPDFEFIPNKAFLSYYHGVIIQQLAPSSYRLIKPDNTIVIGDLDTAKYVTNGLFLIRKTGDKFLSLYSLNQKKIVLEGITQLVESSKNFAQFRIYKALGELYTTHSDLVFCNSLGFVSTERPSDLIESFENDLSSKKQTRTWELFDVNKFKEIEGSFIGKIKVMDDFIVVYNNSYFYLLDNDLKRIVD